MRHPAMRSAANGAVQPSSSARSGSALWVLPPPSSREPATIIPAPRPPASPARATRRKRAGALLTRRRRERPAAAPASWPAVCWLEAGDRLVRHNLVQVLQRERAHLRLPPGAARRALERRRWQPYRRARRCGRLHRRSRSAPAANRTATKRSARNEGHATKLWRRRAAVETRAVWCCDSAHERMRESSSCLAAPATLQGGWPG